ncbi:MAG: cytidylate kinase-like family protein [Lachnospiraceae bacterium]|nr:cytidylate kinase-like family protein [Lachnospiraceae bacterium]
MKNFKVTISREFGCNAREITRLLAGKLGVEWYDKELVDLAAQKAGINVDVFLDANMLIDSPETQLLKRFGYGSTTSFYSEQAIQAQIEVIREIADRREPSIFFGRCADYILREYPNTLNIFLYSSVEARKKHIMETYDLSERSADKLMKRIDRQRHNYYKYVTGVNRGDRNLKHIMIDVERFGSERTSDILCNIVKTEFAD